MVERKTSKSRKASALPSPSLAPASEVPADVVPMAADVVSRKKSLASILQPRLFALIVEDQIKACVWALSSREARGKGEIVLGGAEGRSFAVAVSKTIFPVEVLSVRQGLEEVLHKDDDEDPGELSKLFLSEAAKAVLLQVLGWKPQGFEAFAAWLQSQLKAEDMRQHFPLD